ncbi:MAG: serine/threonine-protein kinase [Sandaracinaceae bacterium]
MSDDQDRRGAQPGMRLGPYLLGESLGKGGMGVVFRATHVGDASEVAVKVLRKELTADEEHRARFEREARSAARVDDPTAVRVHDVGVERDLPYIAMELLHGETLAELFRREAPMDVERATALLCPIGACLARAHAAGVVHRDVKPSNVFIERAKGAETPRLLDFGIAKLEVPGGERLTVTGTSLGSPAYMAPEQVTSSKTAAAASDQFAFGVLLYEAVSGVLPHEAPSPQLLALLKCVRPARPLSEVRDDLPAGFEEVVMRTLELDPAARFVDFEALLAALARWSAV